MRFSRTLQGRLTAMALAGTAATVVVLAVAFNLALSASLDRDVNSRLQSRAAAALSTVSIDHGRLEVGEGTNDAAVDSGIWLYRGAQAIERPHTGPELGRAADALAGGTIRRVDAPGHRARLYSAPILDRGRRVGTVVAGTSLAAYHHTKRVALIGSVLFALLVLAAVGVLSRITVRRALAPVTRMTAQAAEWSDRDPEHRFGPADRPDELGRLAETFDRLLDRVAASIRHEQRLTAELSHELRTPLAKVMAETDMLLSRDRGPDERRSGLHAVQRGAEQMSGILETLITAARADADLQSGRSDAAEALRRAADLCGDAAAQRGVDVEAPVDGVRMPAGVDADLLERIVVPVLENACRHARSSVRLEAGRETGRVAIHVRDDGPGVTAQDAERIFEPGVRLGSDSNHSGAGLGLALARRLARAAGGDLTAVAGNGGGHFRVELPPA